jgi:hypothetical protein
MSNASTLGGDAGQAPGVPDDVEIPDFDNVQPRSELDSAEAKVAGVGLTHISSGLAATS